MSILKLISAPILLLEDDVNVNIIPLLQELVPSEKCINIFSYEQSSSVWENVFKSSNLYCYEEFELESLNKYSSTKCTVIVDSVIQMAIIMGWNKCLKCIKRLNQHENIEQLILVMHKDCLPHSSKLQLHLNHIANAIVTYDSKNPNKVWIRIKKGSKIIKSEEMLTYDTKNLTLKSTPIIKQDKKDDEPEKPSPAKLTTFKIEVDQIDKMEKSKLTLPYLSKINEGESKVYYEPDAVDDWDEEDPDEDLDL